jgi:hypothetical protein
VRLLLAPPLGPQIEHIVQVDIGQQRTDDAPNANDNPVSDLVP